jgi:phosphomannomutase
MHLAGNHVLGQAAGVERQADLFELGLDAALGLVGAADGRLGFDGGEVGTIDGLRVDFADGFGLIRGSNTTPVLVLRCEVHTPQALHRIEAQFMAALRTVKADAMVALAAH